MTSKTKKMKLKNLNKLRKTQKNLSFCKQNYLNNNYLDLFKTFSNLPTTTKITGNRSISFLLL